MQPFSTSHERRPKTLMQRLNRACGEINVVLCAIAIGLAVLDATCLMTIKVTSEIRKAQDNAFLTQASDRVVPRSGPEIGYR